MHAETRREVAASATQLFDYLNDHTRLSSHMSERSWMMAGSRMTVALDAAKGQSVGSRIRLSGRILGLPLSVDEIVTECERPLRKVWETTGEPRLLVIGPYRMGFEISASGAASQLRVFIDYALPSGPITRSLGRLLGGTYARWCTGQMADDAVRHFSPSNALQDSEREEPV
jgi:hypothetical protein